MWDFDGSLSGTGRSTIIGSTPGWWCADPAVSSFSQEWNVWMTPWRERRSIGYAQLYVSGIYDACDSTVANNCTSQYAPYTVCKPRDFRPLIVVRWRLS